MPVLHRSTVVRTGGRVAIQNPLRRKIVRLGCDLLKWRYFLPEPCNGHWMKSECEKLITRQWFNRFSGQSVHESLKTRLNRDPSVESTGTRSPISQLSGHFRPQVRNWFWQGKRNNLPKFNFLFKINCQYGIRMHTESQIATIVVFFLLYFNDLKV